MLYSLVESLSLLVPPVGKVTEFPFPIDKVFPEILKVWASVLSNNEARFTVFEPPASDILNVVPVNVTVVINSFVLSLSLLTEAPPGSTTELPFEIVSVFPAIDKF